MKKNNTAEKAILETESISKALKEGTQNSLKNIMNEAINKMIMESDDDENDEDSYDVEDVDTEETPKDDDTCKDGECCADGKCEKDTEDGDDSDDEWSDMEKYKVGDNDYDFTGVDGDEVLKIYNKLGDDDQIFVKKDEDGNYDVKDEETGAEYVIELNDDADEDSDDDDEDIDIDFEDDSDDDFEDEDDDDFEDDDDDDDVEVEITDDDDEDDDDDDTEIEITDDDEDDDDDMVNESDEFTTKYQKNVFPNMSNSSKKKPGTREWDDVPEGSDRPWSGYEDKYGDPFTKKVNEDSLPSLSTGSLEEDDLAGFNEDDMAGFDECFDEDEMGFDENCPVSTLEEDDFTNLEEAGYNVGGYSQQRSTVRKMKTNSGSGSGRQDNVRNGGENGTSIEIKEAFVRNIVNKARQIQNENKKYSSALNKIKKSLNEAAVVNVSLGQIVKLLLENTTNAEEKKNIVERFNKVKTIKESKVLYDTIKHELNSGNKSSIMLEKQISANGSVLNETTMYQNKQTNPALNLMDRLENLYK